MRYVQDIVRWLDHQSGGAAIFAALTVVLIVLVLVLVLRAARDSKLERFKFRFYGSLRGSFGLEVESQRESAKLPPNAEPTVLLPGEDGT